MSKHIYLFVANENEGADIASRRAAAEFINWDNGNPVHEPALYQPEKTPTYIGYTGISSLDEVLPRIQSINAPLVVEVLPINSLLGREDIYRHHGIHTLMEQLTTLLETTECPYVVVLGLEEWRYTGFIHSAYRVVEVDSESSSKQTYSFNCVYRKGVVIA